MLVAFFIENMGSLHFVLCKVKLIVAVISLSLLDDFVFLLCISFNHKHLLLDKINEIKHVSVKTRLRNCVAAIFQKMFCMVSMDAYSHITKFVLVICT